MLPGTVPELEIERLRLAYDLAALGPEEDPVKQAAAAAAVAKKELEKSLDSNRKVPGTVPAEVIEQLRNVLRDQEITALGEEIKSLREEVQQLHKSTNKRDEQK